MRQWGRGGLPYPWAGTDALPSCEGGPVLLRRGCAALDPWAEARTETEGKYNIMVIKAGHDYDIS